MNSLGRHLERLWVEIDLYLEIVALLQEDDSFWKEYVAWKRLTETKARILKT